MKKLFLIIIVLCSIIGLTGCKKTVTEEIITYDVEKWFNVHAELELDDGEYYVKVSCNSKDPSYVFGGYIKMFCVYLNFEMTNGDGNIKYPWKFIYLKFDENGYAEEREWLCSEVERGIESNPKITKYEIHHSRDIYVGTVTYEKNVLNCK